MTHLIMDHRVSTSLAPKPPLAALAKSHWQFGRYKQGNACLDCLSSLRSLEERAKLRLCLTRTVY
jgi:hypothetical protein